MYSICLQSNLEGRPRGHVRKVRWWWIEPGFIFKSWSQKSSKRDKSSRETETWKQVGKEKGWGSKKLQGLDLCLHSTLLTLFVSPANTVLSWPRLLLITLDNLRLYFFCSSIQRSSEHSLLLCFSPPSRSVSTQWLLLSKAGTTEAFPSVFSIISFLALDWLVSWPPFCMPLWGHSLLVRVWG